MDISRLERPSTKNFTLHNNLLSSVTNARSSTHVPSVLTKEITPPVTCTNQKGSGRCWIFAALNMVRRNVMREKKLKDSFEFSQSHVFFYDKLERMNYNLKLVEDLKNENHLATDRLVQHLLKEPFCDGGQWVMFTNVVSKYGLVPQEVYPESLHSSNSAGVNMVLSRMFRTYVKDIYKNTFNKQQALQKTYEVLIRFFGEPPTEFTWNYKEKDKVERFTGTPVQFMTEFCSIILDDYVSLTHDPRHTINQLYGVQHLGNVEGGEPVKYLNIPIQRFKAVTKAAIDNDIPVWFGSDVGQFFNSKCALLDKKTFDYTGFLDIADTMTKRDRIDYCESTMTHAMCYVGYNEDQYGSINYWKIENSWGCDGAYKGHLICSDDWFKEYTYQLIVPKKYLEESELTLWNGEISQEFPLWDPMGSLA